MHQLKVTTNWIKEPKPFTFGKINKYRILLKRDREAYYIEPINPEDIQYISPGKYDFLDDDNNTLATINYEEVL